MMEIAKIKDGVSAYMFKHVMPKMDSKGQFLLGLGLGVVNAKAEALVAMLAENEWVKTLGLIRDGDIDWDTIYMAAMTQLQRQQKLVLDLAPLGRLVFDEQDLRDLHMCIKGGVN